MVELKNLSLRFPHNDKNLLKNITFSLPKGSITGLTGPSGCGKTLLGLVTAGIIPSHIKADLDGEINRTLSDNNHSTEAAIVFQDPSFQLFAPTVYDELLYTPRNLGGDFADIEDSYNQIVAGLNLKDLLSDVPRELSMGEIQRVAIGTALIQHPHILILDEPTQYIDPFHLSPILSFITKWIKKHNTTVLLIEHNKPLLKQVCDEIYFMTDGTISDNNNTEESLCPAPKVKNAGKEPLVHLDNISYGYQSKNSVLKDINLTIHKNETIALLGPNGSGKTTLAKVICGLYKPQSGTVTISGNQSFRSNQRFKYISYVMQNPDYQIFSPTVMEECSFGSRNFGIPESEYVPNISHYLRTFNMDGFKDRDPFSLSYGEKRRINITSVLSYEPEIIILDEPTCALDYVNQKILLEQLKILQNNGKTLILITHDLQFARAIAGRVLFLHSGNIIKDAFLNEIRERDVFKHYTGK